MILFSIPFYLLDYVWYVSYFAVGIIGVACFRLSKRGAGKTFAISAWLAIASVGLLSLGWMLGWGTAYLPGRPDWIGQSFFYFTRAANIAYFGHLLAFAVAAFRISSRLPARSSATEATD